MLQFGYEYAPYSSLESIVEQNKAGYYAALRRTQSTLCGDTPDWQPWLYFFLSSLGSQVKRLGKKVEREKLLANLLPQLSLAILTIAREHGSVTAPGATEQTGAKYATVRLHISKLVKQGYLEKHGAGRSTKYVIVPK